MNYEASISGLKAEGMSGRVLSLPAQNAKSPKKILLIYGVHSSIERMASTAEFLSQYGSVSLFDLPGLGGMDSFYTIGRTPSLDAYADYVFQILKVRDLTTKVTVVAMSFGFLVITRMLQIHPEAEIWFDDIISFVGFGRSSDFKNLNGKKRAFVPLCRFLSTAPGSLLVKTAVFNRFSLRGMFWLFKLFNPKYKHGMASRPEASIAMELALWQNNDARTKFKLYELMFDFDLSESANAHKITVPLHDLTTPTDQYFDAARVHQTLGLLYQNVSESAANLAVHAPSVLGDAQEIERVFSPEAKAVLAKSHV